MYIYNIYIISWDARVTCAMENFPKAFYNIHSAVSRNELSTPLRDPVSKHDTFAQLTSPFRWSVENISLTFNSRDARLLFSCLRESFPALSHVSFSSGLSRDYLRYQHRRYSHRSMGKNLCEVRRRCKPCARERKFSG